MPPIGDTASEGHDEVGNVHESDTEAENKSTKSGGPYEEPSEGLMMPRHMMGYVPLNMYPEMPIQTAD